MFYLAILIMVTIRKLSAYSAYSRYARKKRIYPLLDNIEILYKIDICICIYE